MLTQQYGGYTMVAPNVKMKPMASDVAPVSAIDDIKERMQRKSTSPELRSSFFEPDAGD